MNLIVSAIVHGAVGLISNPPSAIHPLVSVTVNVYKPGASAVTQDYIFSVKIAGTVPEP